MRKRPLLALVALTSLPAAASAKTQAVTIPPELDGIVLPTAPPSDDFFTPTAGQLLALRVVADVTTLGDGSVLVFEETRRWKQKDSEGRFIDKDVTALGIADAKSKAVYARVPLKVKGKGYAPESGGKWSIDVAYTAAWTDLDGDGARELVLTRKKGRPADPLERVFQVRFGGLRELPRDAATCPRDATPLSATIPEDPLATIDYAQLPAAATASAPVARAALSAALAARDPAALRCALALYPMTSDTASYTVRAATPIVFFDAPAAAPKAQTKPAMKPGTKKPAPPKDPGVEAYFLDRSNLLMQVSILDGDLAIDSAAPMLRPTLSDEVTANEADPDNGIQMTPAPDWADLVAQDGAIFLIAQYTFDTVSDMGPEITPGYHRTDVFIYDLTNSNLVAEEAVRVKKKKIAIDRVATLADTNADGVPELAVGSKKGKTGAVTYRYDKSTKSWTK